jgi:general stress protein 26
MQVDRKVLHMTDTEVKVFISANRYGRLGTANTEGQPHVVPVGYVDYDDVIYFMGLRRSRRTRDIEVNSRVAFCIDDGAGVDDPYGVRRGAVLYGSCNRVNEHEELLERVKSSFVERHGLSPEEIVRRTHDWYRIDVERVVSWDFRKIPVGADWKADRARNQNPLA